LNKILITGVSGYIAPYLCKALLINGGNKITGVYNSNKPNIKGIELIQSDISTSGEIEKIFAAVKPDIVYHLASVTPTRITTQEDDYIKYFNSEVTANIAKLCNEYKSLLIYTSTDLVYKAGINLKEEHSPLEPLTIYAKTKLLGEDSVNEIADKYLILRTSLVYGFTLSNYTSFFDIAYRTLKENKELRAFTDQFRNALYIEDAADILVKLPLLYKQNDIINFCGSEYLSRYEMCIRMCDIFGFDKKLIIPANSDEFIKYPMVKELGLKSDKLTKYGLITSGLTENLKRSLKFIP
jgi:dTDP-4-dehydrorhamnose reductase